MATSVNTSLPLWLTGCTYDGSSGNDLRNSGVTATFYDSGVTSGGGTIGVRAGVIGGAGLFVAPGTGMSVNVQPGSFVVANTTNAIYGGYVSTLASQATLAVAAADPTNPRLDIIVAYVSDVGSSASFGAVAIITGTAAPSPTAPTPPANSLTLAQLLVPNGTSTITAGQITDERTFTTATGGVLVAPKGSVSGYAGQIGYDPVSGTHYHNNNISSATQLKVLPWSPVTVTRNSQITWGGPETSILTATFTTDGYTDVAIFFKWPGVFANNPGNNFNTVFRMYVDSTQLDGYFTPNDLADNNTHSGGSWTYYTSGATGDTPSAGTHTAKVTCQNLGGSIPTGIYAVSTNKIILRVAPVSK